MSPASARCILIVDDEPPILDFLADLFRSTGWDVHEADSGTAGIEKLERNRYDVVLTDLKMPGPDGLELLRTSKGLHPDTEVVLMTGYGSVDTAIEAMRAGAFHYLTKPFKAEEVLNLIEKAYAQRQLRRENLFLKAQSRAEHQVQAIVGTSAAVQEVTAAVQRLADTDTPVLLVGERGAGKTFYAKVIHYQGPRAGGLFVPVPCAGVPENVLESDLFGHAAGAYERAVLPRAGKLEMANHGTVFLDGLAEAGPKVQERLVRLLATKTVTPVGSDREIELDVRFLASSPAGLDGAVARGNFLGKLQELLAPGTIRVPSLRERADDVPLFLHYFLYESNRHRKKPLRGFSQTALQALSAYTWPGNIKELKELVQAIAARKKQGTIVDAADLPPDILYGRRGRRTAQAERAPEAVPDLGHAIEDIERPMVLQALALTGGDRERAAELLHIEPSALDDLMRRHNIDG